jgi:hypothetical protein
VAGNFTKSYSEERGFLVTYPKGIRNTSYSKDEEKTEQT